MRRRCDQVIKSLSIAAGVVSGGAYGGPRGARPRRTVVRRPRFVRL